MNSIILISSLILFLSSLVLCQVNEKTKAEDIEIERLARRVGKQLQTILEECEEPVCKRIFSKDLFRTGGMGRLITAICGGGGAGLDGIAGLDGLGDAGGIAGLDGLGDAGGKRFDGSSLPSKYTVLLIILINRLCGDGVDLHVVNRTTTRAKLNRLISSIPPHQLEAMEKLVKSGKYGKIQ